MAGILFLNRFFAPDESATSRILSDLAAELARGGEQVTVVTSRLRYDDPAARLPAAATIDGVRVVRVWTSGLGRQGIIGRSIDYATFYLSSMVALWRLTGRDTIVVAKTDPPLIALPAALVVRMRGGRLVCWMQDIYPEVAMRLGMRWLNGPAGHLLARARDRSLRFASAVVVLGERMAEFVAARGIDPACVHVIPNWSVSALADAGGDRDANPLRAQWGIGARYVVGYSGNLGRAHEPWTMLDAARLLRDRDDIVFLLIGEGSGMRALRAAAEREALGNVVFQPFQPAAMLRHSLAVPDVHWISLLPELEGLIVPSKVYGAMAIGRPIIAVADAEGEVARMVRAEDCGVQVTPGDGAAMAAAVAALCDDRARGAAMGARGAAAARDRLSRDRAMERWRALLATLRGPGKEAGAAGAERP